MKIRRAVAQFQATVILIVISLALVSIIYDGMRKESTVAPQPVFANHTMSIGGSPVVELVDVNSSEATSLSSFSIDSVSSVSGIIAASGSSYTTSSSLCAPGDTTFFSVLASQSGSVQVSTDGQSWISGTWATSKAVAPGWQEIMIDGGHQCTITLPGGQTVPSHWSASSPDLSSIPSQGPLSGTSFAFYVPSSGAGGSILITSSGGFDDVSL